MSGRTVGTPTPTHPIWGTAKAADSEPPVLRSHASAIARQNGWTVRDGHRDEFTGLQEVSYGKHLNGGAKSILAGFDKRGRCQFTNACHPSRLLLLLAGACTCEGEPRTGPFDHWKDFVTDSDCIVHRGAKR